MMKRRTFLTGLMGGAMALPLLRMRSAAATGSARRLIVFYFPDGVAASPQAGGPSAWHAQGTETSFTLSHQQEPLAAFKNDCVFLNGLSMGPTDVGSHPGGAKKLLTASDGGNGESIDQYLARTAGSAAPWRHLYLGAMANQNNATGDKHISYPSAGTTTSPEDDPLRAFARLFPGTMPTMPGTPAPPDPRATIIDTALADMNDLRAKLGDAEKTKLDLHLEALREVEKRVKGLGAGGMMNAASCANPKAPTGYSALYEPKDFPAILRAQIDVMVQAMACGLTQVGVVQASLHTSELIMSRFVGSEMYDPGFDMRSHQASHYGASQDPMKREFRDYVSQRRWFASQFAYLLEQLKQRPEGQGTMLDNSVVLMCTEICDGNTHAHDNMPFIVAGGAGGAIKTGRLLQFNGRRHADLLISLARAMGDGLQSFGQQSSGPLPGLVS